MKLFLAVIAALVLSACGPNGLCGNQVACGDGCMPEGDTCCNSGGYYCDANHPVCFGGLCYGLDVTDPGANISEGVKGEQVTAPKAE